MTVTTMTTRTKWSKRIRWSVVLCLFFAFLLSMCVFVYIFSSISFSHSFSIGTQIFIHIYTWLDRWVLFCTHISMYTLSFHCVTFALCVCIPFLCWHDNWYELFGTWHKTVMRAYRFNGVSKCYGEIHVLTSTINHQSSMSILFCDPHWNPMQT